MGQKYRRRGVIGFYKDRRKRTRPITPRMGRRRFRYNPILRVPLHPNRIQVEKQILDAILTYVLSQAPFIKELQTACSFAYALYKNWSLIDEIYDIYNKEGWAGVTNVTGINRGKQILANIMGQVTSGEIKLVSLFLQSRGSQKLTNCKVEGGNIDAIENEKDYQRRCAMFNPAEINELIKEYGKKGVGLLILFKLIKSRVKLTLQQKHANLTFSEAVLDKLCMARAYEQLETWEGRTGKERH
jgi:hypothetical protein